MIWIDTSWSSMKELTRPMFYNGSSRVRCIWILVLIFETHNYSELEQPSRLLQPTILNDYLIDDFVKDKNDAAQMREYHVQMREYHVQKGEAKFNHDPVIADNSREWSAYDRNVTEMRNNHQTMYTRCFSIYLETRSHVWRITLTGPSAEIRMILSNSECLLR